MSSLLPTDSPRVRLSTQHPPIFECESAGGSLFAFLCLRPLQAGPGPAPNSWILGSGVGKSPGRGSARWECGAYTEASVPRGACLNSGLRISAGHKCARCYRLRCLALARRDTTPHSWILGSGVDKSPGRGSARWECGAHTETSVPRDACLNSDLRISTGHKCARGYRLRCLALAAEIRHQIPGFWEVASIKDQVVETA